MALLTHDYYCPKIGMASELHLLVPDEILRGEEQAAGTLFLLPPQGESGLSLFTGTKISALSEAYRIAVVVPPALQGCFTDMVYGYPFYQSLKYVREYLKTYLPGLPVEKGCCAVAGLGISAIAALRFAAEEPDFFACAGSIAGILDPSIRPQGYFTESRLTDLFGTEEEQIEKREAFFTACGASETRKVFLFSEEEDLRFASTKKAAEIFGNRAVLRLSDSPITLKACSDALGKFVEYWIGGTC